MAGQSLGLVNMKLPAEKASGAEAPCAPDAGEGPRYPWGLSLSLDNDSLEKLGIDALPDVDDEMLVMARVKVTRVSAVDTADGGKQRDVALQITDMQLAGKRVPTADVLFGKQG